MECQTVQFDSTQAWCQQYDSTDVVPRLFEGLLPWPSALVSSCSEPARAAAIEEASTRDTYHHHSETLGVTSDRLWGDQRLRYSSVTDAGGGAVNVICFS